MVEEGGVLIFLEKHDYIHLLTMENSERNNKLFLLSL